MKKIHHLLFLCLPILLILSGCKGCKDNPQPGFTEGYYFYCKVNGNDFIPAKKTGLGDKVLYGGITGDSIAAINCLGRNGDKVSMGINEENLSLKNYGLDNNVNFSNFGIYYSDATSLEKYKTNSLHTGVLSITKFDKQRKLIEGTFNFNAIDSTTMESVSITDGRFSLY
jgi:hypothetical protein